jgi:hypothetical protein
LPIAVKGAHDASGIAVSPVRTRRAMAVPAGADCVQEKAPQLDLCPASRTREVKLPEEAYGVTRSQSTDSAGPPEAASLASARRGPGTATACVATRVPSA